MTDTAAEALLDAVRLALVEEWGRRPESWAALADLTQDSPAVIASPGEVGALARTLVVAAQATGHGLRHEVCGRAATAAGLVPSLVAMAALFAHLGGPACRHAADWAGFVRRLRYVGHRAVSPSQRETFARWCEVATDAGGDTREIDAVLYALRLLGVLMSEVSQFLCR